MAQSESIKELAQALSKAQSEFPVILKNRTAQIPMKSGQKYSYKYADLADVISAVMPVLSRHGLSVIQSPHLIDGRLVLETLLMHSSGEWKNSYYPLQSFERAQEMGSEITYARRYTLSAVLGVHAEEDEDGALATLAASDNPGARGAALPAARAIPNPFPPKDQKFQEGDVTCERCNEIMRKTASGEAMYCPNFKMKKDGEHTYFRIAELPAYRAKRREEAEAALEEEWQR